MPNASSCKRVPQRPNCMVSSAQVRARTSATVLMPAYAVRLFRRSNVPMRMMYGRDDLNAPQYDLQLLVPQVMGRTAEEVSAGAEQPTNDVGSSAFDAVPPAVFWSVLAVSGPQRMIC